MKQYLKKMLSEEDKLFLRYQRDIGDVMEG